MGSRSHGTPQLSEYVDRVRDRYGEVRFVSRGSSLKFCLVAEGAADIYPRLGPTMEWDTAAGQIIVEEAGGRVVESESGLPMRYNKQELTQSFFCRFSTTVKKQGGNNSMMPLFMIGTQRSGSNLLRLMLNQLPEIAAPHPPHILQRMMPVLPLYGDLTRNNAFKQLVDDVCRLVEHNPVAWSGVSFDRVEVAERSLPGDPVLEAQLLSMPQQALVAIHGALYDMYAESQGAKTWCCKSLANINYFQDIEFYFENARYIYLYRDGRDVAVSFRKAVVGEKHFYHIAREWAATQKLALAISGMIDPGRFMSVSYEELTRHPEQTCRKLCAFMGVEYRPQMLEYSNGGEARSTAKASELWGNLTKPVLRENTRKFLREAGKEDIMIFESVAGPVLDELGYSRSFVQPGEEISFTSEQVQAFTRENNRLKEAVLDAVDPADRERRDKQASLLKEIRERYHRNYAIT